MKPIYFPFTYIPESVGKALAACFGQTTVYQISDAKIPDDMQSLVQDGILDIRMPMPINGKLLDKIHKDYRAWIDTHQGTEITFLKTMAHKIPFLNKDAPSQIRAELKNTIRQIPAREKPDPLFNAGLFLHMAQEYDFQNERLSRDLRDIDSMEADFIEDLKGEAEGVQAGIMKHKAIEIKDPGRYMTAERIAAWASFMLKDSQRYGLLITSSRAVVDHILDILPETNEINRFDAVSAGSEKDDAWDIWRSEFMTSLEMLAIHTRPAGVDDMRSPPKVPGRETNISLTLYMVPEKAPRECFTRFLDTDSLREDSTKTGFRIKNTLIGLVEVK
jgi:hypothetical protein